jgi:DNA polymerase II small subunit/DNA polymerase delta subunit B
LIFPAVAIRSVEFQLFTRFQELVLLSLGKRRAVVSEARDIHAPYWIIFES